MSRVTVTNLIEFLRFRFWFCRVQFDASLGYAPAFQLRDLNLKGIRSSSNVLTCALGVKKVNIYLSMCEIYFRMLLHNFACATIDRYYRVCLLIHSAWRNSSEITQFTLYGDFLLEEPILCYFKPRSFCFQISLSYREVEPENAFWFAIEAGEVCIALILLKLTKIRSKIFMRNLLDLGYG